MTTRQPLARIDLAVMAMALLAGIQLAGLAHIWTLAEQARREQRRRLADAARRLDDVDELLDELSDALDAQRTFVAPERGPAEVVDLRACTCGAGAGPKPIGAHDADCPRYPGPTGPLTAPEPDDAPA